MKNVLYIDAANLIMSAKSFSVQYDLYTLLNILKHKYSVDQCIYFTARFSDNDSDYRLLESLGVELVYKESYKENQKLKANCDVEITERIVSDMFEGRVKNIILLSGDGDFNSLLLSAKDKNVNSVVVGVHPKTTSYFYRKQTNFKLTYVSQIMQNLSLKRKELLEHKISTSRLFDNASLSHVVDKSMSDFSVGVFAYITDPNGKILLVQDCGRQKLWTMPGGGLEYKELVTNAVMREVFEELGVKSKIDTFLGIFSLQKSKGIVVLFQCSLENNNFTFSENEVADAKFFTREELELYKQKIKPAQYSMIMQVLNSKEFPIFNNFNIYK